MRLSGFWYELVLDLIAGGVFVGAWVYFRVGRGRAAPATGATAAAAAMADHTARRFTPIATADAYPAYALMSDAQMSDADGPEAADGGERVCQGTQRVPVRFTGELARLAEPAAVRALPRYCLECLQEVRREFPNIEAVGLPLRCARHRIKFDDWIRVGGVQLRRHHLVYRGREILN